MSPRMQMFGANVYFLIGLLIALAFILVLVIALWTALKVWLWESDRRKVEQAKRLQKLQADGRPCPPTGRGICDGCARGFESVYHLPSGRRLCPECYERDVADPHQA